MQYRYFIYVYNTRERYIYQILLNRVHIIIFPPERPVVNDSLFSGSEAHKNPTLLAFPNNHHRHRRCGDFLCVYITLYYIMYVYIHTVAYLFIHNIMYIRVLNDVCSLLFLVARVL